MVVSLLGMQDVFESQRHLVKVNPAVGSIDVDVPPSVQIWVTPFGHIHQNVLRGKGFHWIEPESSGRL